MQTDKKCADDKRVGSTDGLGADPICGNCGKALSKHYHESEVFCFTHTNGDVFTDEPNDSVIFAAFVERHPDIYDALVADWKAANGHTPNASLSGASRRS